MNLPVDEEFVNFTPSISTTLFRLAPIPQTGIESAGPFEDSNLEFVGPNRLDVIGKMGTFSAIKVTVPEVGSTALLLTLALVALGFLRTRKQKRQTPNSVALS